MKSGKVVLGVLAGLAAGALLGVLLAPDKGSRTRRKVLNFGEDVADTLKEKFDDLSDTIADTIKKDKKSAEKIISKVKTMTDEVKKEVMNGFS